jgi:hypothetical protein
MGSLIRPARSAAYASEFLVYPLPDWDTSSTTIAAMLIDNCVRHDCFHISAVAPAPPIVSLCGIVISTRPINTALNLGDRTDHSREACIPSQSASASVVGPRRWLLPGQSLKNSW